MLNLDLHLLQFALLTAVIEVPIFYLCGYKQAKVLLAFAGVNIISNLLLNENMPAYNANASYWLTLIVGELLVVALEYTLMLYIIKEEKYKFLKTILLTNAVSLGIGLVIFFR